MRKLRARSGNQGRGESVSYSGAARIPQRSLIRRLGKGRSRAPRAAARRRPLGRAWPWLMLSRAAQPLFRTRGDREPLSRRGARAGLLMAGDRAPAHARLRAPTRGCQCETLHLPRTDCLPRTPAIACFSGRVVRSRRQRMGRRTGINRRIMLSLPASPQSRSQAASPTETS